ILLGLHSLLVAVIIVTLIILLVLQIRWSIKKRTPWRHERKTLIGEIHGHVADAVTNNLVVKTFANEQREVALLDDMMDRFRYIFQNDFGFMALEGSLRVAFMIIVQIIAISAAAYLVFNDRLDIAIAIFALAYLQRIGSHLFVLGDILNGYDQALLEAAPMSDILTQQDQITDAKDAKALS